MSQENSKSILGVYEHYKGQKYHVIELVRHSETLELLVLYEALYDNPQGRFWVRPKNMFFEKIVINGKKMDRFRKLEN